MNLLVNTNLEVFTHQSFQAEIFRLQGEFYKASGEYKEANLCYGTAVGLNQQLPEPWLSWGTYCDEAYERNREEKHYLEYIINCYFQAITLQSNVARDCIPRCLYLLSVEYNGIK